MRHRLVQCGFEMNPAVILDGVCAVRPEMERRDMCRLLRDNEVTLDEIVLELDLEEVYAKAMEYDDLEEARDAAAREIALQLEPWFEERFADALDRRATMHRVI